MRPTKVSVTVISVIGVMFLFIGCSVPVVRNIPLLDPEHAEFNISHEYSVESPQFQRAVGSLLGPGISDGNRITTLLNGDQIFPAMLDAISHAERTITFETFVYWNGDIGERFARALSERARAGVKVHVVIDWIGMSRLNHDFVDEMKRAGVQVILYNQLHWYDPRRFRDFARLDNRTHRKILVIDGKVGFTGGVGIADLWKGNAQDPDHWRDTHFRVEGPVVAELQSAFIDNWIESGGHLLHGDDYFPPLPSVGNVRAQVFKGSPEDSTDSIELMYRMAIVAAEREVLISNAYFVPDEGIVKTLIDAAERGVKIKIMVPGTNMDQQIVRSASRSLWGELLDAGVKIYEFNPTMLHCKVMVIDGYFTSVGSTNFDNRSFHLNDEVNLNIFDRAIAAEQIKTFEADEERSHVITKEQWAHRPLWERVTERLSALLRADL